MKKLKFVETKLFFKGTSFLCQNRISHFRDGSTITRELLFPLKEISAEECFKKRISSKPGIILKKDQNIYFANLSRKKLSSGRNSGFYDSHLCSDCLHCASMPEEFGGCSKVMDRFPQQNIGEPGRWLRDSCMLEKYDFITYGSERFNESEFFYVFECKNFEARNSKN